MAAEICDGRIRETDITLTPVHDGRFEVYVNGTKLYDRKEAKESGGDFLPSLRQMRLAQKTLADAIAAAPAETTSH